MRRSPVLRRLAMGVAALGVAIAGTVASATPAEAATTRYLNCATLAGSGSYSNPKLLGTISVRTVVQNCPALSSGSGYNLRYFKFTLPRGASGSSLALTYYHRTSSSQSGVHPRIANGAYTVRSAASSRYYQDSYYQGFYQALYGLPAGSNYRLGAEKLSSPLGSVRTAPFNILIVP
ncbi:hypothetical protein [Hamadaea tsunoensis]|uniref:hypothetical protein n=1 Tax=Hamadaea tsunoensis TaxID=53368 RepID=UPI00040986F2|nr:hypothetical protein [Hamadaea tsunoensis]